MSGDLHIRLTNLEQLVDSQNKRIDRIIEHIRSLTNDTYTRIEMLSERLDKLEQSNND